MLEGFPQTSALQITCTSTYFQLIRRCENRNVYLDSADKVLSPTLTLRCGANPPQCVCSTLHKRSNPINNDKCLQACNKAKTSVSWRCSLFWNNYRHHLLQVINVPSAHFRGQLLPVGSYPFFEFLKVSWFMFVPQVRPHGTPNLLSGAKVRTFSWTLPPADPVHVKDRR